MLGLPADLLSLLYLIAAVYTLWQLPSRWRGLTDETYTADDRNLANRVGFLLLTPIGVLIHELSHMAAAMLLGGRNISLSFRIYWGYVQYRGPLPPEAEWVIAAVGPASSMLLGLVVGFAALRLRQPWRDIGMSFAHATLLLVLVLYPGLSVIDQVGDFRWIYSARTPTLSVVAGVVHALGLAAYIVLVRQQSLQTQRENRAAMSEAFAGHSVTLRPEIVARLDELEAAERVRRLEP
jgi:Peptidase M50B-like